MGDNSNCKLTNLWFSFPELRVLVFVGGGKPTTSTHGCRVRESNPGHNGGRRALSGQVRSLAGFTSRPRNN